jgi:transposase-like protein
MPNAETPFPVADASARRYGPRVVVVEVPTACPKCQSTFSTVKTSRAETSAVRRRYRVCDDCGAEFVGLYEMRRGERVNTRVLP